MLISVAQAFNLAQSPLRLFIKRPTVDDADESTGVRVLPSSWPEVLDMVEFKATRRSRHLVVQGSAPQAPKDELPASTVRQRRTVPQTERKRAISPVERTRAGPS